jgi:hypothetical protein
LLRIASSFGAVSFSLSPHATCTTNEKAAITAAFLVLPLSPYMQSNEKAAVTALGINCRLFLRWRRERVEGNLGRLAR